MSKRFRGITVQLTGEDGNAFAVMMRVNAAMRRAGCSPQEITDWQVEARACRAYEDLLAKVEAEFETR